MKFAPYLLVVIGAIVVSALLPSEKPTAQDAGEVARTTGIRILGATRGYATAALWLRAGEAYDRGDLYETLAAYQLIRKLQPRNPAVYSYLAWNQAFNISAQFPERERREVWVVRGFQTLHEGQRSLPRDASLRFDEWHFILNRTSSYPVAVLRTELPRFDAPAWKLLTERVLQLHAELSEADRAALDDFLMNIGLEIGLFDTADDFFAGEEMQDYQRPQVAALMALPEDVRGLLALAHFCRVHAMFLAIRPALEMRPHSLGVEAATLTTASEAWDRIPPGIPREEFEREYKEAVAQAFVSGIENALRIGGEKAAIQFVDDMKFNFREQPELLPPEVIDRAYQEIQ